MKFGLPGPDCPKPLISCRHVWGLSDAKSLARLRFLCFGEIQVKDASEVLGLSFKVKCERYCKLLGEDIHARLGG